MVRSDNQLQVIVADSGLEPTKGAELLRRFEDYFSIAAEWETRAKAIIITDDNCFTEQGKFDMQSARNGRLFLRDKRIAIEKARKEREAIEAKARVEREAAGEKARKDKAAADAAIAHAKAEQARLLRQIQSEIECPHCHKKFKLA